METGKYNEKLIEVISGLKEGDKIITKGNLDVSDGMRVTTEKENRSSEPFIFRFF